MPEPAPAEHKPYVEPSVQMAELSPRATLIGMGFGVIFGAVTVYLALKVGLTVSASIPIAVLAIMIFRRLGRSTILENNIVQTIGSAGESIASGVVFTLPALIFLNSPLPYYRILLIALAGGTLGVLMMIPLRRALIVREHGILRYPEGTACANILVAGEKGGSLAGKVFAGLGVGALYKALQSVAAWWKEVPGFASRKFFPGMSASVEASPELLGVGYIIGFRASCILVAGGVLSWTVLIPMVKFLGAGLAEPIFPGRIPIAEMEPIDIWKNYIRYIGAGGVAAGGVINLGRALPTIVSSFRDSIRALRDGGAGGGQLRTERDLPITLVGVGSLVLVIGLWALFNWDVNPGHPGANAVAALLIVIYGFFFVTVSSRVVGMIGSSNNPISGDTITTLMGTCLLFVMVGWTGLGYAVVALSIGAVVCIAAANAGATSQDLKTGFLVGATPRAQQIGLVLGVVASTLIIGVTLNWMNEAYHTVEPASATAGFTVGSDARRSGTVDHRGTRYELVYLDGAQEKAGLPDGRYLVDKGEVKFRWVDGVGSRKLPAPQARLMSLVVKGILDQKLPWTLVLLGIFIGLVVELCGVHALPFAVGLYLPLSTTTPVFFGGLMKFVTDRVLEYRHKKPPPADEEVSEGMLFSSGLIAGGALMGVAIAALILGSGKSQIVANALETLRGDGVRVEGKEVEFTLDNRKIADGEKLPVRSKWVERDVKQPDGSTVKTSELVAHVKIGEEWKAFESLPLTAKHGDDVEKTMIEHDAEARSRVIRFEPTEVWMIEVPRPADGKWLVSEGTEVGFGQPLAENLKSPATGRFHERGAIEVLYPAAKAQRAEKRRIDVEALPSSDAGAMLIFLGLCAILVWSSLPKKA